MVWTNDLFGGFENYLPGSFGVWDCNDFGAEEKADKVSLTWVWTDTSVTDNFDKVGFDRVGSDISVGYFGKVGFHNRSYSFGGDRTDFDLDHAEVYKKVCVWY